MSIFASFQLTLKFSKYTVVYFKVLFAAGLIVLTEGVHGKKP